VAGTDGEIAAHDLPVLVYLLAAVILSTLLGVVLVRVIKHQYLPHKIFARKVYVGWIAISLTGSVIFAWNLFLHSV
jgi:uncharacterized membrane protein YozB (DUF420 family)